MGPPAATISGTAAARRRTRVSGPGQKALHELNGKVRHRFHYRHHLLAVADMHDQWVAERTLFGSKNAGDGFGIQGIGSQPINGLGGESDQPSLSQQPCCLCDCRIGLHSAETERREVGRRCSRSVIRHLYYDTAS